VAAAHRCYAAFRDVALLLSAGVGQYHVDRPDHLGSGLSVRGRRTVDLKFPGKDRIAEWFR
jgi:hypothetical protein